MIIERRIRSLMAQEGLKPNDIAEITGWKQAKTSKIINGKVEAVKPADLNVLSRILKVNPSYISDESCEDAIRYVPVCGTASCGVPCDSTNTEYELQVIPSDIYTPTAYSIIAEGESMSPTINNEDIVVCDESRQVQDGDIVHYIVQSTGESGIKRYKSQNNMILLVPDNSKFNTILINKNEDSIKAVRVVAKVESVTKL